MNNVYLKSICQFEECEEAGREELSNYKERILYEDISNDLEFLNSTSRRLSDIIFSTSTGVFIYISSIKKLIKILSGKYYGLTKWEDWWIATRSNNKGHRDHLMNNRISDLIQFKLDHNYKIIEWKNIMFGIPGEVHQIDIYDKTLYIPHTDFNQVLTIDIDLLQKRKLPISLKDDLIYSIEIQSNLSSHINSIYINTESIYIVAHNFTMYTQKLSELIILDKDLKQKEISLAAHSAHNIVKIKEDIFYCDSNNKLLYKNKKSIFKGEKLLRGLSITDKEIYVGGSDICFEQRLRYAANPTIYGLDQMDYSLINEIEVKNIGDLYEIRQLNNIDYTLSRYS
mgnify:CR=1 FL=1